MGKEKNRDLASGNNGTTPICRCRVMYLGSSVPHATKDGLQGIQEPLRELYPETGLEVYGSVGIDSWISVWSNGILIENVDDSGREIKRFYPIESLHYCAAVRYVVIASPIANNNVNNIPVNGNPPTAVNGMTSSASENHYIESNLGLPQSQLANHNQAQRSSSSNSTNCEKVAKFLPLDSPFLRNTDNIHPPLFACILRRTTGIKVLECHAFICKKEPAANALVRCCFHAYADSMYAKQIEDNPYSQIGTQSRRRSRSISALDKLDSWNSRSGDHHDGHLRESDTSNDSPRLTATNGHRGTRGDGAPSEIGATSTVSHSPDEDNYNKPWSGIPIRPTSDSMMMAMINNGGTLMRGMGPPPPLPPLPNGKVPRYVLVPPPSSVPPPQLAPYPHPAFIPFVDEKTLKHSLKKKKKKSSKCKLTANSMMIAPPFHPSQMIPNGMIPVPQCSPQGPPMPPHPHPQFIHPSPHHAYGPLPPLSSQPPPPPSTAYSVRERLRRGPTLPPAAAVIQHHPPDSYPIMYASNEEPVYIPPMRPLTPLSNYHPHHTVESHYVQYPIQNYGTTPRRPVSNGNKPRKDRAPIIGRNGSAIGASSEEHDPEREASPSTVGLYRRKGHLNERAFSYSIRQEHRSRSNSLANLQFDDGNLPNGADGVALPPGPLDRRSSSSNNGEHAQSHHLTNGRLPSSVQRSIYSSDEMIVNGDIRRDSIIVDDHRRDHHSIGLSQSMANLNLDGTIPSSSNGKQIPKTASIKRSKARYSLGSRGGLPIAPPLPPVTPNMINGKALKSNDSKPSVRKM